MADEVWRVADNKQGLSHGIMAESRQASGLFWYR